LLGPSAVTPTTPRDSVGTVMHVLRQPPKELSGRARRASRHGPADRESVDEMAAIVARSARPRPKLRPPPGGAPSVGLRASRLQIWLTVPHWPLSRHAPVEEAPRLIGAVAHSAAAISCEVTSRERGMRAPRSTESNSHTTSVDVTPSWLAVLPQLLQVHAGCRAVVVPALGRAAVSRSKVNSRLYRRG
jgi:hypothetical protein